MPDLVLHFDPDSGVDLAAVAKMLQQKVAEENGVQAASVRTPSARDAVQDVIMVISLATTVVSNANTLMSGLEQTIKTVKTIAADLGLKNPRAEVGMTQVPTDQLTPAQMQTALTS